MNYTEFYYTEAMASTHIKAETQNDRVIAFEKLLQDKNIEWVDKDTPDHKNVALYKNEDGETVGWIDYGREDDSSGTGYINDHFTKAGEK